ncbi:MAG TPA: hypothetical protein VGW12_17965 [Pyrinomonadaceae bacterium]|nr:hypothetical protein [Pyrinomonadaceae bacterium]
MRQHLPHFIFALCLAVVASSACNDTSGGAQQSSARQTNAAGNTNAAAIPAAAANNASAPGASPATAFDVCALLTSDDIKDVQGEAVRESKPSRRAGTEFAVSSCFYTTPTFTKSVSLEVTQKGTSTQSVRDFWKANFAAASDKRERKNERRKKQNKPLAGEPARPLEGIGDEAYWVSTNANSTLYAFKKDALIRISIGGTDNEETRMKKMKTLAERALARL